MGMNLLMLDQLADACASLQKGDIVAFPTETVYGIGALYSDPAAQREIFRLKKRSADKPLMAHIASIDDLDILEIEPPKCSIQLIETFLPGPLAIIFSRKDGSTLGIRMPDNIPALRLIHAVGEPIMATSANLSGQPSPRTAADVRNYFAEKIPFILDGGTCPYSQPSTILSFVDEENPKLLRAGPISKEEIEIVIGKKIW